jgi:hypothetical protein
LGSFHRGGVDPGEVRADEWLDALELAIAEHLDGDISAALEELERAVRLKEKHIIGSETQHKTRRLQQAVCTGSAVFDVDLLVEGFAVPHLYQQVDCRAHGLLDAEMLPLPFTECAAVARTPRALTRDKASWQASVQRSMHVCTLGGAAVNAAIRGVVRIDGFDQ